MSDDAAYMMELFNKILGVIEEKMFGSLSMINDFDRLSYSSWAINQTLIEMYEYEYYLNIGKIREILKAQKEDYERYYNKKEKNMRFKHALDTVNYMLELTGGYLYD